jgi:DNA-binding LacI/PurR family transcriptional regulator
MSRKRSEAPKMAPKKRVTLQDIADVAGVKKMAVSNALNGAPNVSAATRAKIERIVKELNYIPNFAARALTTGRTGIIAVMCGAVNEPYYANIIHFLEKQLNDDGFQLLLIRRTSRVQELVTSTGIITVDGGIVVDMPHLVNEFEYHPPIPCVSIGTFERPFLDNVVIDLSRSVNEAMDIMISRDRRRIAYLVTAPGMALDTEVRAKAYLNAMKKIGQLPEIIDVNTNDLLAVDANFRAYIEESGCPDALFCQNDDTAMTAFRVIRDAGYRVPEDVLLLGCDGQWHTRNFDPPLSTIAQPIEEMCLKAWQFLRQRLAEPTTPLQRVVVEGTLLVRESLGMTPER